MKRVVTGFIVSILLLWIGFILGAGYIVNYGQQFETGMHIGNLQAFSDLRTAIAQARKDKQPAFEISDRTGKIHLTIYVGPEMEGYSIAGAGADVVEDKEAK